MPTPNNNNWRPLEHKERWTKPDTGVIKCNIYAAVFPNRIGLGCVPRDAEGVLAGARLCTVKGHQHPKTAEALGILKALS